MLRDCHILGVQDVWRLDVLDLPSAVRPAPPDAVLPEAAEVSTVGKWLTGFTFFRKDQTKPGVYRLIGTRFRPQQNLFGFQ